MLAYVSRRLLEAVPLIALILVVNFVILHMAPGDPVSFYVQGGVGTSQEYVESIRKAFGLDKPIIVQLGLFLRNVLRGELGYSFYYRQSVAKLIGQRIPVTLLLVAASLLCGSLVGIVLGVIAGMRPYSVIDLFNTMIAVFGHAIPVFWFGQMLILVFAVYLKVLPTGGVPIAALGGGGIGDWFRSLILPVTALGGIQLALIARITRANMLEILGSDYITTARSKGLSESAVTFKHALKNAILPVVTVIGMNFGYSIGGALLTETVFTWPGLGRIMLESLLRRDYPVLMGLLIVISVSVVILNLLTDVLYAYLDPRIVYR